MTFGAGWAASTCRVEGPAPRRVDPHHLGPATAGHVAPCARRRAPLTPTTTTSPGPTMLTNAASMPAEPVPDNGQGQRVGGVEHGPQPLAGLVEQGDEAGSRWPSMGRRNAAVASG